MTLPSFKTLRNAVVTLLTTAAVSLGLPHVGAAAATHAEATFRGPNPANLLARRLPRGAKKPPAPKVDSIDKLGPTHCAFNVVSPVGQYPVVLPTPSTNAITGDLLGHQ